MRLEKNAFNSPTVMWPCCIWCLQNTFILYAYAFPCMYTCMSTHTHTRQMESNLRRLVCLGAMNTGTSSNPLYTNLSESTVHISIAKSEFFLLHTGWSIQGKNNLKHVPLRQSVATTFVKRESNTQLNHTSIISFSLEKQNI